jgi:hypothetical protein
MTQQRREASNGRHCRAWAAEIARNKEGHATWKEDCRVLNQAAKEIENLREENKRLRRGDK